MWLNDLPAENSVKCGNIYIPTRGLNAYLKNCIRPVLAEIPDAPVELRGFLSASGSATLIKIKNQPFICITRHQLSNHLDFELALNGIRVLSFNINNEIDNITFSQAIFIDNQPDEETSDVIFLRVNKLDDNYNLNAPYFLPIRQLAGDDVGAQFIFVGYPIQDDAFTFANDGVVERYHASGIIKDCVVDKNFKANALHLNKYTFAPYNFDEIVGENGLSGGSVFGLKKVECGFELFHCGIIVRAGNGNIYTISTNHLLTASDKI